MNGEQGTVHIQRTRYSEDGNWCSQCTHQEVMEGVAVELKRMEWY